MLAARTAPASRVRILSSAARSSGRVVRSVPFGALPTAVRTELTSTASRMAHLRRDAAFIAAVGKSSRVLQKPYAMKSLSQMIRTALGDATVRRAVPTTTTDDAAESVPSAAPASTSISPPLIISKDN